MLLLLLLPLGRAQIRGIAALLLPPAAIVDVVHARLLVWEGGEEGEEEVGRTKAWAVVKRTAAATAAAAAAAAAVAVGLLLLTVLRGALVLGVMLVLGVEQEEKRQG